ncbi:MAG: ribosomal-protein-serine acetyltransferase [Saprospiraceae bacterium]|jgi:ribosomal-protein-serine acetyltransferase
MINQFENFTIKEFDTRQGALLFKLIDENRSRLEDFFPVTVAATRTLANTLDYCRLMEQRRKNKSYFPFIIIDQKDNSYVGFIDIKNIEWKVPKAEVGYFIDQQYEGQGVISKALSFVLKHVVEKYGIKKMLSRASTQNLGSMKVALNNGFELEGTIRSDFKTANGEIVDLNYYGKVFNVI